MAQSSSTAASGSTGQVLMSNNDRAFVEKMLIMLQCPVCYDFIGPPIMQCEFGHLVCSNCHPRLESKCPICCIPLGNIINRAMEEVVNNLVFPCKYEQDGCLITALSLTEKINHEDYCDFSVCRCPFVAQSCTWQGPPRKILEHLQTQHTKIPLDTKNHFKVRLRAVKRYRKVDFVRILTCSGHHFLFVIASERYEWLAATVMLIGSHRDAERFSFKVSIFGHRHRTQLPSTPHSCHLITASQSIASSKIRVPWCTVGLSSGTKQCGSMQVAVSISQEPDK